MSWLYIILYNNNPGLNSVLLALARFRMYAETSYTPVSQVFPNALWEWKKNADRTSYPKKFYMKLNNKKTWLSTRGSVHNVKILQVPIQNSPLSFWLAFPNESGHFFI